MKIYDSSVLPFSDVLIAIFFSFNVIVADLLLARQLSVIFTSTGSSHVSVDLIAIIILLYSISSNLLNNYILADLTFRRGHALFVKLFELYCINSVEIRKSVDQESIINTLILQITNICGGYILPLLTLLNSGFLIIALLSYFLLKLKVIGFILLLILIPILFCLFKLSSKPIKSLGEIRLNASKKLNYELENISRKVLLVASVNKSQLLIDHLSNYDQDLRKNEKKFLVINSLPGSLVDSIVIILIFTTAILSATYPKFLSGELLASSSFLLLKIVSKLKLSYVSFNKILSYNPALNDYNATINSLIRTSNNFQSAKTGKQSNKLFGYSSSSILFRNSPFLIPATLENDKLFIKYKDKIVENSINLITGISGSGKSTFLRDYLEFSLKNREQKNSIFIDQYPVSFSWTMLENISLFSRVSNIEYAQILDLVKLFKLEKSMLPDGFSLKNKGALNLLMPQLSGGEMQRFCLIRALCKSYDIVFMDEPLSSQDATMAQTIISSIKDYHKKNPSTTMIIISHYTPQSLLEVSNEINISHG